MGEFTGLCTAAGLPRHVLQTLAMPAACQCLPEAQELPAPAVLTCVPPAAPAPQPHRPSASLPAWVRCRQLPVQQEGQSHATPQSHVPQPCPLPGTTHPTRLSHSQTSLETTQAAPQGKISHPGLLWQGCIIREHEAWPVRSLFPPLVLQVAVIQKHQLPAGCCFGLRAVGAQAVSPVVCGWGVFWQAPSTTAGFMASC